MQLYVKPSGFAMCNSPRNISYYLGHMYGIQNNLTGENNTCALARKGASMKCEIGK